jgi:hypothetical protein
MVVARALRENNVRTEYLKLLEKCLAFERVKIPAPQRLDPQIRSSLLVLTRQLEGEADLVAMRNQSAQEPSQIRLRSAEEFSMRRDDRNTHEQTLPQF